jgi:adenine-specific DNA-methyltransferase
VYKDDFKDSIKNYKEQTNQTTRTNPETSGRYHTDWLNMMYSRLMLAKNLLSDDGVIFVSIDENENFNLRKMLDDVFGGLNYLSTFTWISTKEKITDFNSKKIKAVGANLGKIKKVTEYIECYSKTNSFSLGLFETKDQEIHSRITKQGNQLSRLEIFKGVKIKNISNVTYTGIIGGDSEPVRILNSEGMIFKDGVLVNDVILEACFANAKMIQEFQKGKEIIDARGQKLTDIYFTKTGLPYMIKSKNGDIPSNLLSGYGDTSIWRKKLENLFETYNVFDYPKPTDLLKDLISISSLNNSIILDFFSGSATTAHAVMQLNAEDGGNRKFIMVQLPEKTSEDSEAYKAGYKNICEIGKERIRRAGELVKKDLIEKNAKLGKDEDKVDPNKLDIGFKVFKLDESNFKEWDSSKEPTVEQLELFADPIKEGKSEEEVLYEILLKYGVFDQEVKKLKINNKDIYSISDNYLLIMLSNKIEDKDIEEIKKLKPKVVIFRDSGFNGNDTVKINAFYNLTKSGVEEVKSV